MEKEVPIQPDEDSRCLARVRAGDVAAYAELVRRHASIATRTAQFLGAGADADDVVQDAFVKVYASIDRFRSGDPFRPWLLRIVANETHNLRRARSRRSARESKWADLPTSLGRSGDETETAVLSTVRQEELMTAVESLPEDLRAVVVCRYLLELSGAETAVTLQLRPGTVKSRLHRALGTLRQEVHQDE